MILYAYNNTNNVLDKDFEDMAELVGPGATLVIPMLGTNNGYSFFDSAEAIFKSIVSSLATPNSHMHALASIVAITPFNEDQRGTGVRTMNHIFNLMRAHRYTKDEADCPLCMALKPDVVASCGHRFCTRCMYKFMATKPLCPICNELIHESYPCYKSVDCTDFVCCVARKQKEPFTFVPCGHKNALCSECANTMGRLFYEDGKPCPVCKEFASGYIRVY